MIWDAANGMRDLKDVLQDDHGLNLIAWTLTRASAVSADGITLVGYGQHNSHTEGWIATIPGAQPCPELTGDGVVDAADLAVLLGSWGPCSGCSADLNGDSVVDAADLAILIGAWGPC